METESALMRFFMPLMEKLTPRCDVISLKISESLDHPLSRKERLQVRIHLLGCELCDRYRRQMMVIRRIIRRRIEKSTEETTPADVRLSEETRRRIKEAIRSRNRLINSQDHNDHYL